MPSVRITYKSRFRGALALAVAAVAATPVAAAHAQSPVGPPGPPPGNGASLPAPPGTAPVFVPPGTAAAIPGGVAGPGRLSGDDVLFNRKRRAFALSFACAGKGRVSVVAGRVGRGALARASYRCARNRATARLTVSRAAAKRLASRKTFAATATVQQGAKTARLSFVLRTKGRPAGPKRFWTDGHLQCTQAGAAAPQALLVEPDFTTRNPTRISTRAWVAWHTARGGWHWLGELGENAGRWHTWTSTFRGIDQFHPGGVFLPQPWTWGPISVPVGRGIRAVGVYEIVYWVGGKPEWRWHYVNAGTTGAVAAGGGTLYCVYP